MVESDPGVCRSATIWLELKGETALAEAGQRLAEARSRGDARAAQSWLKIIAALEQIDRRTREAGR